MLTHDYDTGNVKQPLWGNTDEQEPSAQLEQAEPEQC